MGKQNTGLFLSKLSKYTNSLAHRKPDNMTGKYCSETSEGEMAMPSIRCLDCHYEATTRTSSSLMKKLKKHDAEAHHMKLIPPRVINNINTALRKRIISPGENTEN